MGEGLAKGASFTVRAAYSDVDWQGRSTAHTGLSVTAWEVLSPGLDSLSVLTSESKSAKVRAPAMRNQDPEGYAVPKRPQFGMNSATNP